MNFIRIAVLCGCIWGTIVLLLGSLLIDRGVQVDTDAVTWQIMHTFKGSFGNEQIKEIRFARRDNPQLQLDVCGYFIEDELWFVFPKGTDIGSLRVRYTSDLPLEQAGHRLWSGLSSMDLSAKSTLECGDTVYSLHVLFTSLPVLEWTTADGYLPYQYGGEKAGVMNLFDADGTLLVNDICSARVRGNTTSTMSKLPFRLETCNDHSLLGLPTDHAWSLLANFFDPSFLKNQIAFDLARNLKMPYSPQQRHVEMYVNGKYLGIYTITTEIGVRSGNITLPALSEQNPDGTFLAEFDVRSLGVEDVPVSLYGYPIFIKEPDNLSDIQRQEIVAQIHRLERAISANDMTVDGVHYSELVDMDSLVDYFIVTELTMNSDTASPLSVYVYRTEQNKLALGPVWDFDLAFVNDTDINTQLILEGHWWWKHLLRDDALRTAISERLMVLEEWHQTLEATLAEYEAYLYSAAVNDHLVSYIGVNDYTHTLQDLVFSDEVADLYTALHTRYTALYRLTADW